MHYGLTNAPASFQRLMSEVFKDILEVCVVVYLYDILIYSEIPTSTSNMYARFCDAFVRTTLYAKVKKRALSMDKTDFLGFVIGPDGL
jgi:hypothetical protein